MTKITSYKISQYIQNALFEPNKNIFTRAVLDYKTDANNNGAWSIGDVPTLACRCIYKKTVQQFIIMGI